MNSSEMDLGESVIFQPVLQAYPSRHSWIITAHILLGNLESHWKLFNRQLTRTQQFLRSGSHASAPTQLLSTLQLELSNIQDIYVSIFNNDDVSLYLYSCCLSSTSSAYGRNNKLVAVLYIDTLFPR